MRYTARLISRWWSYMWGYFCALVIANLFLMPLYKTGGLVEVVKASFQVHQPGKGGLLGMIFMTLGPLLNVYVAVIAAKCAIESDDDLQHEQIRSGQVDMPDMRTRVRVIWLVSLMVGIVLLPATIWTYTAHVSALWPSGNAFWAQPGLYLCLAVLFFFYFWAPRKMPGLFRHIGSLEDKVTDTFSKHL